MFIDCLREQRPVRLLCANATKRIVESQIYAKMDFSRLPDHIGVKIFHYLPIEYQARIARVSRRFNELSTAAISTTTKLELCNPVFKNANLEELFLSARNLKTISVCCVHDYKYRPAMMKNIELISELMHPQLIKLYLYGPYVEAETMSQLLMNCPNIRYLSVGGEERPSFNTSNAPSVTRPTIESLEISYCSEDVAKFYADICPRIKRLDLSLERWTVHGLNEIIAKFPDLEHLTLAYRFGSMRIDSITNLRRLSSLRSLTLRWHLDDQAITVISNRLDQVEELSIHRDGELTLRDIGPLSTMKNLRRLYLLFHLRVPDPFWDTGISHLSGHQRLEYIHVDFQLTSATVIALANNCPQLKRLVTLRIDDIDSRTKAKQFIKHLRGFIQKMFTIAFVSTEEEIWQSNTVKYALSRINATSNGRSISIRIIPHYYASTSHDLDVMIATRLLTVTGDF